MNRVQSSVFENGYAERAIGSIRRECLDHIVVVGERHLRHVLASYQKYYHEVRTHLSLEKTRRFGVMCAAQDACVRRRSWAGYTIDMFEFEFPTGTDVMSSNDAEKEAWLSSRCHDLKHKPKAAGAIIIELKDYLRRRKLRATDRKVVQKALTYFENNGHMMTYPSALNDNLPIGSGVTDAACKTLVKQRLGGAGMGWTPRDAHVVGIPQGRPVL